MQVVQNRIQLQASSEAQSVFLNFHLDETAKQVAKLNVIMLAAGMFFPHSHVYSRK
jgi:hypothetical protein